MKRGRKDTLTGGTDDVNPQWVKFDVDRALAQAIAPQANFTTRVNRIFRLPVQRINQSDKNTATIIEILKARWSYGYSTTTPAGNEPAASINIQGFLSTAPAADITANELRSRGTTIDWFSVDDFVQPFLVGAGGPPTTYTGYAESSQGPQPFTHDLTDGDGHGVLVATDGITLVLSGQLSNESTAGGSNITWDNVNILCEVLYRYKKVSLTEYVGIVQSQERGS